MSSSPWYKDPWRLPTFCLWLLFFAVGLFPEWTYWMLRAWGQVTSREAMINSDYLLTLALAAFFGHFVFRRALEVGLSTDLALAKALQCTFLSLAAFLPIPFELLLDYHHITAVEARRILLGASAVKLIAWLYLLALLFRYYFLSGASVFLLLPSLIPRLSPRRFPLRHPPPELSESAGEDHAER